MSSGPSRAAATTVLRFCPHLYLDQVLTIERNDIGNDVPNITISEARPSRHCGATDAVANDEKGLAGGVGVRPRRQVQVPRRRHQSLFAHAMAVAVLAVADGAVGSKDGGARLLSVT